MSYWATQVLADKVAAVLPVAVKEWFHANVKPSLIVALTTDEYFGVPRQLVLFVMLVICTCVHTFLIKPRLQLMLHAYQMDFLEKFAILKKTNPSGALIHIVKRAYSEDKVTAAVYDDFHCIHCGSVSPAAWIKERKGTKTPYTFLLTDSVKNFLNEPMLVKVEKVGDPPKKQVVKDAPRTSDASKSARCCIDWAIKHYGALADGTPKAEKAE